MAEEETIVLSYIHEAAKRGHAEQVEDILSGEKDLLNAKDSLGNTPLHWGAGGGHLAVCDVLLKAGADANITNKQGATLHYTEQHGREERKYVLFL